MTAAPIIPLIGLAISAIGTGAAVMSAKAQADFQSEQAEENAKAERTAAALRAEDREERRRRVQAQQQVQFGAQGSLVDPNILASTAREFAKEQYEDDFNTQRRIAGYQGQAASAQMTGKSRATGALFDFAGGVASDAQAGAYDGLFE